MASWTSCSTRRSRPRRRGRAQSAAARRAPLGEGVTIALEAAGAGGSSDGVALRFRARETAAGNAVVLSIHDVLDHLEPVTVGASVETVLDRLDVVLRARPVVVVADLGPIRPSRLLVGLLGIMRRRAARAGASLVLVDPSSAVHAGLDEARVAALGTTAPTVDSALRGLKAHRRLDGSGQPDARGEGRRAG